MTNEEKIKKAIKDYCPEFNLTNIRFQRADAGTLIYDLFGSMNEPAIFSVYPFVSINAVVLGATVLHYRAVIKEDFLN